MEETIELSWEGWRFLLGCLQPDTRFIDVAQPNTLIIAERGNPRQIVVKRKPKEGTNG